MAAHTQLISFLGFGLPEGPWCPYQFSSSAWQEHVVPEDAGRWLCSGLPQLPQWFHPEERTWGTLARAVGRIRSYMIPKAQQYLLTKVFDKKKKWIWDSTHITKLPVKQLCHFLNQLTGILRTLPFSLLQSYMLPASHCAWRTTAYTPSTSGIMLQSTQGMKQNKMHPCSGTKAINNSAFLCRVCNHPCTMRIGARNSFLNGRCWVPRITLPWNSKVPRHHTSHPQEMTPFYF